MKTLESIRAFFIDEIQVLEEVQANTTLDELRVLEKFGREIVKEFNDLLGMTELYELMGYTEEEVIFKKSDTLYNLEIVIKAITIHEKRDVLFYSDLGLNRLAFYFYKN